MFLELRHHELFADLKSDLYIGAAFRPATSSVSSRFILLYFDIIYGIPASV